MTKDELVEKTDNAISELVTDKHYLQKAYNYYYGIRDKDQFKYLEDNFGLGNPTSIEFTPLIKKHIDALIGEYIEAPIIPKVACKDIDTVNNIYREKQLKIAQEIQNYLTSHLKNYVLNFKEGKDNKDPLIAKQLQNIIDDLENSFISEYEIAAQNVVDYIMQSKTTDFSSNLRTLVFDTFVSGCPYYKVEPSPENNTVKIRVLDPLNTFPDRNYDSPYVKDSYRVVVRSWLTKNQILNKYGKEMSKKDRDMLKEHWTEIYEPGSYYVKSGYNTKGILADEEMVIPGYPNNNYGKYRELLPVYEVEWIETDDDFVMQRYETVRIGEEIYILRGKNDKVIRSKDNPSHCTLSVNGVYLLNRNSEPWSMVLACAHLQDKYDLLCFYRDNLIANSGTIGDWIDETLIPEHLGVNFPERLKNWIALKKQGIGLINTAQEDSGQSPINTIFNGYDATVKSQAIQAIQIAIDAIEQTVSSITGVFRERLNGIQQRDAVSNVKVGQSNSFIITKQYHHQIDTLVNEILLDCLNTAKSTFKNGLTGTIVLGDKYQKVFTALPEHFTVSDHDIRILSSQDAIRDIEYIKQLIPDFIKNNNLSPEIIFEAITTKSLTDLKIKVRKAMQKQREENNQLQQASQQVEQLQQQLQEVQKQAEEASKKVEQLNQEKLKLEKPEIQMKNQIEWFKAQTDRSYKETMAEETKKRTEAEILQLADGNPYNDKIRQTTL